MNYRNDDAATGGGEPRQNGDEFQKNNNAARYEKQGFFDAWETRSVSLFQGIKPEPTGTTTIFDILNRIKKGTYQKQVEYVRAEKGNKDEYARRKNNLPGVTFSCAVKYRGLNESEKNPKSGPWNLNSTNGLIVADLDHLANLDGVKDTLQTDPNILFVFTSPGGDGLKIGIRAEGISAPEDHTRLYFAVERYFKEAYGLIIDPACKDLARLCFVSFDPELYINNDACLFDVSAWSPEEKQKSEPPPRYEHNDRGADRRAKYGHKVLKNACTKIRQPQPNNQHYERRNAARTVGGFIASGFIDESEAMTAIEQAVIDSGAKNISKAMQTVKDGIRNGKQSPIFPENWNDEPGGSARLQAKAAAEEVEDWTLYLKPWPILDQIVFRGIAGRFVELACRKSEADPAAVLITGPN